MKILRRNRALSLVAEVRGIRLALERLAGGEGREVEELREQLDASMQESLDFRHQLATFKGIDSGPRGVEELKRLIEASRQRTLDLELELEAIRNENARSRPVPNH